MADEITLRVIANLTNGSFKDEFKPAQISVDQAALGADSGIRSIGTSEENVTFTDITTEGYLFIQNLDATNYVTIGPDSTGMVALIKLKPGEFAMMRLDPAAVIVMQANTSDCDVQVKVWED